MVATAVLNTPCFGSATLTKSVRSRPARLAKMAAQASKKNDVSSNFSYKSDSYGLPVEGIVGKVLGRNLVAKNGVIQ